jgi:hypothetical protein
MFRAIARATKRSRRCRRRDRTRSASASATSLARPRGNSISPWATNPAMRSSHSSVVARFSLAVGRFSGDRLGADFWLNIGAPWLRSPMTKHRASKVGNAHHTALTSARISCDYFWNANRFLIASMNRPLATVRSRSLGLSDLTQPVRGRQSIATKRLLMPNRRASPVRICAIALATGTAKESSEPSWQSRPCR